VLEWGLPLVEKGKGGSFFARGHLSDAEEARHVAQPCLGKTLARYNMPDPGTSLVGRKSFIYQKELERAGLFDVFTLVYFSEAP
jgi:hypothetical protein